jgi:hypothetical protein
VANIGKSRFPSGVTTKEAKAEAVKSRSFAAMLLRMTTYKKLSKTVNTQLVG